MRVERKRMGKLAGRKIKEKGNRTRAVGTGMRTRTASLGRRGRGQRGGIRGQPGRR